MVYTALSRISINGTSYRVGDVVKAEDVKTLKAEKRLHFVKNDGEKETITDQPPTPPTPPLQTEDPKTDGSEGTNIGEESNPNAPTGDASDEDEDPEDLTSDPDIPPASNTPIDTAPASAITLLSKKMGELQETANTLGLPIVVGEKKEALVDRILKQIG